MVESKQESADIKNRNWADADEGEDSDIDQPDDTPLPGTQSKAEAEEAPKVVPKSTV